MNDDLIRRSDAIEAIRRERNIKALLDIPAIKPKQGEWIKDDIQRAEDTDNGNYRYTCSVCGYSDVHARTQEVPYCWWCGSRMKGVDNETN